LLDAMSQIYSMCSKGDWASIYSLSHKRLEDGLLYQYVKRLVITMSLIALFLEVTTLEDVIVRSLGDHAQALLGVDLDSMVAGTAKTPAKCKVVVAGAELRVEPHRTALLRCYMPLNAEMFCSPETVLPAKGKSWKPDMWLEIRTPMRGWIRGRDVVPKPSPKLPKSMPELDGTDEAYEARFGPPRLHLLAIMYHARRTWCGECSRHMCWTSSTKLLQDIETAERQNKLVSRLGHGPCRVVMGSFLAQERRITATSSSRTESLWTSQRTSGAPSCLSCALIRVQLATLRTPPRPRRRAALSSSR